MLLLHQKFQRATRRNKGFSGRGASPSAPCMTWFSLLFSSFFLSLSFLGARSQQPPAPRRQPEFQQIRAVFCWGIFVVAAAVGLFLSSCFCLSQGNRVCGRDQRALRSPSGLLRSPHPCSLFSIVAFRRVCGRVFIANFPLLPPVPLHRKKQTWYDNQTNRQGRMDGWTRRAGSSC